MKDEDQFEQRLRRQPVKPIPSAWREEILSAASVASPRPGALSTLRHQLATLFWPHPKAWAGLAAVWLVILMMNFVTSDKPTVTAGNISPASADTLKGWRHQEQLLAELNDLPESREAERPKAVPPRPRSQRREEILTA